MTDTYAEKILTEKFKELEGLIINEGALTDNEKYPEIAFPNEPFERPVDENGNSYWYELYFIPAVPVQVELGTSGRTKWIGILQVNVCIPKNDGMQPLYDRFDSIANLYRSGANFDGVRISRTYRSSALDDGDFYVLPVSIEWWAYLER